MNRTCLTLVAFVIAVLLVPTAHAATTNVAQNALVELHGAPFFTGGWVGGLIVDPDTLVDGVFLPKSTQWNQGAVWWDSQDLADRYIVIRLGAVYRIEGLIVQGDNNDFYELAYREIDSDTWELAWAVPNVSCWGLETRPDPANAAVQFTLPAPVVTDALIIRGDLNRSDRYFAVSEVQAFGPLLASIDIKPGSDPNCFNLNGHGVIPVAILGSEDLDVTQIDLGSVLFAGLAVRVRSNRGPLCTYEFSNDDAYLDLVCHFEDDPSAWSAGETEACVTAALAPEFGSTAIEGCDSICLVP